MENLRKKLNTLENSLKKSASKESVNTNALKDYLELSASIARRVEASKTVMGFMGGSSLTGLIDNVLRIATPLVAISGDFELSNLLGSLKIWLDKKKAEEAAADAQRQQMFSQDANDLNFTYGF